jgi:hypothetical protein
VEVTVQRALAILALVMLSGVAMAEIHLVSTFTARSPHEPGWRRTAQGWIKVGPLGDAAFVQGEREPVTRGALHPLLLTAFVTLASLAALMSHESAANTASPARRESAERSWYRPHFRRAKATH